MERDYRYLAGLFDGEGCVAVSRIGRHYPEFGYRYQLRVTISNTYLPMLESLQREFGGAVWSAKAILPRHKKQHQWVVWNSTECADILRGMLPYLRYKDREASYAIKVFEDIAATNHRRKNFNFAFAWAYRGKMIRAMLGLEGRKRYPLEAVNG